MLPSPQKAKTNQLKDYSPVALTLVVMKVFEQMVLRHIKAVRSPVRDKFQFAYGEHWSIEDAVSLTWQSILEHFEKPDTYASALFVD